MQLFYSADIENDTLKLSKEENTHLVKSLRKKIGDEIYVTDGKGNLYTTTIKSQGRATSILKIIDKIHHPKTKSKLHVAISPLKNVSRLEWFLEKATELGIDHIYPTISDHSEKTTIRLERCEKIIISAMKQSLRYHKPSLHAVRTLADIYTLGVDQKIMAATSEKRQQIKIDKGSDCLILIGPEGGYSDREITKALEHGFELVSLGEHRLRSETAGVAVCQIFATCNG